MSAQEYILRFVRDTGDRRPGSPDPRGGALTPWLEKPLGLFGLQWQHLLSLLAAGGGGLLAWRLFPTSSLPTGFDVWVALLVLQATLLGAIAPRLAVWRRDLQRLLSPHGIEGYRRDFWGVVLLLVVFTIGGAVAIHFLTEQLPDSSTWRARLIVLEIWGLACVSEAVQGLRIVYLVAHDERWETALAVGPTDSAIESYRTLQTRMRLNLNVLGLAITSVVIADGALLQASAACTNCAPLRGTATSITLLVGLLHAAGLAFIYLPPLSRVDGLARNLVKGWVPISEGDRGDLGEILGLREKLYGELKPAGAAQETLQTGAIIIGPLLAAVIAAFVPT